MDRRLIALFAIAGVIAFSFAETAKDIAAEAAVIDTASRHYYGSGHKHCKVHKYIAYCKKRCHKYRHCSGGHGHGHGHGHGGYKHKGGYRMEVEGDVETAAEGAPELGETSIKSYGGHYGGQYGGHYGGNYKKHRHCYYKYKCQRYPVYKYRKVCYCKKHYGKHGHGRY